QRAAIAALHDRCADEDCRAYGRLEIDHLTPWADGGPTTLDNLAPLCGATHDAKTHRGRQLHPIPDSRLVTAHPERHQPPQPDRPPDQRGNPGQVDPDAVAGSPGEAARDGGP